MNNRGTLYFKGKPECPLIGSLDLLGKTLASLGSGSLKFRYDCTGTRTCLNGGSQAVLQCDITFGILDQFTNPADLKGTFTKSDTYAKDKCYEKCNKALLATAPPMRESYRIQTCVNKCNKEHIRTDIEHYPLGLGISVSGNPYTITGEWTRTYTINLNSGLAQTVGGAAVQGAASGRGE